MPTGISEGDFLNQVIAGFMQIAEKGGLPEDGVLVNGDSGNDIELFEVPGVRGCIVGNAMEELRSWAAEHPSENIFQAQARCAGGIIEAIQHFQLD
jgi:sucrose-6-phosphatase